MAYLLDTHTFLWFINGDAQLSERAQKAILATGEGKYISIASFWEIAIKMNLGKLVLDMSFPELQEQVLINGFEIIPVTMEHISKLIDLELHHRDPFDRIIISQAYNEDLVLISRDQHFSDYDKLKLIW